MRNNLKNQNYIRDLIETKGTIYCEYIKTSTDMAEIRIMLLTWHYKKWL
nr:MAG TPA: hypothetical protein [Caudoviricetes sp.]